MKNISYVRVSAIDQNPDRQLEALPAVDKQFLEKASGSTADRPVLQSMIEFIREGDIVHVHSIDRLARNLMDLDKLVKQIAAKGCSIKFYKENLTFGNGNDTAISTLLFHVMGSFAQFERSLIRERQQEGIAAAKSKGKHLGRPSLLTQQQKEDIRAKKAAGINPTKLAKEFGVSRATIYGIIGD